MSGSMGNGAAVWAIREADNFAHDALLTCSNDSAS
jgi:hypothetical protein